MASSSPSERQGARENLWRLMRNPKAIQSHQSHKKKNAENQSACFIEVANKTGEGETGNAFEKAFKKVVKT
jgi:hypothetical protein